MHELSIAHSMLETVLAAAAPYEGARVRVVRLRIGELRQVIGPTLMEAFSLCAEGTAAEDAMLAIDWVPTVWECRACGQTRPLDDEQTRCSCAESGASDRLRGSDDLMVTSLDLDDE